MATMTTTTTDQQDLVDQLILIAGNWLGPMPTGCEHMDPMPERLNGVVHSFLVNLEGNGGIRPHRVTPNGHPSVDLLAQPGVASQWLNNNATDPHVQTLLDLFRFRLRLVGQGRHADRRRLMGEFIFGILCDLEGGYVVAPQYCDEDGDVTGEGDDVAPGLPDAFQAAWDARRR